MIIMSAFVPQKLNWTMSISYPISLFSIFVILPITISGDDFGSPHIHKLIKCKLKKRVYF